MVSDEYDSSIHEDREQAQLQRGRQYEDQEDLSNSDPNSPDNDPTLRRQENQDQDDILLPGSEDFGELQEMEIEDGNEPDSDDGGLSGIRPSEEEEIDTNGRLSRSELGGL